MAGRRSRDRQQAARRFPHHVSSGRSGNGGERDRQSLSAEPRSSPMKAQLFVITSCVVLLAPQAGYSIGERGGHGGFAGGSGGRVGGGGGGERREFGGGEAMHRTPSMSGGSGPMNRPANRGGGMVPHGGNGGGFANRERQPEGNHFAGRPDFDRGGSNGGFNRGGEGARPGNQRPGFENRPGSNNRPGGENRPGFGTRPGAGGG